MWKILIDESAIFMIHNNIKGVIFDMDGVIVDSEEFILQAARAMFEEQGLKISDEDFAPFVGTGEKNCIRGIAREYGHDIDVDQAQRRTYDIYLAMIKGKLKPIAGVIKFIEDCKTNKLKIAVASSAESRKVEGNLAEVNLSPDIFDTIITGELVENKKPSPEIFLLAAERIGVEPSNCLVIEDAVSGVKAAKAAGALCLAITSSFSEEELQGADYFANDLVDVGELLF